MDSYVDQFQAAGGSMVMLAKGNRSKQVTDACKKHGGFYLGSIGGPAARLALDNIRKVEVLEYPELGMEAVWKIDVVDFPAFIVVDDKGNDFFEQVRREATAQPIALGDPVRGLCKRVRACSPRNERQSARLGGGAPVAYTRNQVVKGAWPEGARQGKITASIWSSTGGQTKSGLLMRSEVMPCIAAHIAVVTVKTSGRRRFGIPASTPSTRS